EFRHDLPLAMCPAFFGNGGDPVKHQHRRKRKLGIARSEQFSAPAGDQIVVVVAWSPLSHGPRFESPIVGSLTSCRPATHRSGPIWTMTPFRQSGNTLT